MCKRLLPEIKQMEIQHLLSVLENRFKRHPERHPHLRWEAVETYVKQQKSALQTLLAMESSGGEPDVVSFEDGAYFCDCSPESPKGRRSLCYDDEALQKRKENKPAGSAVKEAAKMGIQLLTVPQYHHLQTLAAFDCKTSSWLQTPESIRKKGGALFGDRRYDAVFIYHNGAESYYAARGFRGVLKLNL